MTRHRYKKDPARDGMCVCGYGRAEDVHRMLTWRMAPSGAWVSDIENGAVYRCRTRRGTSATWWPELGAIDKQEWIPLGIGVGVTLAKAKAACEEHRQAPR